MYECEKGEVIKTGITLDRYNLITLSGGNVSARVGEDRILVTPSGMIYSEMCTDDVLVVNLKGHVIEGKTRPSVDMEALLYVFNKRQDINAVIHTHQPYATAVGLIQNQLPVAVTTLANAAKGPVKVCDYSSAASIEMGVQTVDNLGEQLAVILKHHGVMAVGKTLKEALYACVYLEEAAKTYLIAKSVGEVALLSPLQTRQAVEVFEHYGQDAEKITKM